MHENLIILVIALVILGYGFLSKLFTKYNISGPMVFTVTGILLSPLVFGSEPVNFNAESIQLIAEITLIIVLFSDAAALNLNKLRKEWKLPARLLFIGLPITIIFSFYVAKGFFPEEPVYYLLLLALVLAPTDAALGKAVVSDVKVPEKIRSAINVESGLNDGIVFPLLITVIALIISGASGEGQGNGWLGHVLKQVAFGAVAGAFVGFAGAKIAGQVIKKNWMEEQYQNLVPIAIAIFSYYFAEYFGGNGFISAFFSGLFIGNLSEDLRDNIENFAESEGEFLIMICFLVFGIAFIPAFIPFLDFKVIIYSLLSLTVLRMIPVALSLFGKTDLSTKLFIGWFGPRGIASILYILIVIHELGSVKGHEKIFAVISLTIFLSIFLHGLSAKPFANLYARKHKASFQEPDE